MKAQIAIELLEIKPEEAVQDVEEEEVIDCITRSLHFSISI